MKVLAKAWIQFIVVQNSKRSLQILKRISIWRNEKSKFTCLMKEDYAIRYQQTWLICEHKPYALYVS